MTNLEFIKTQAEMIVKTTDPSDINHTIALEIVRAATEEDSGPAIDPKNPECPHCGNTEESEFVWYEPVEEIRVVTFENGGIRTDYTGEHSDASFYGGYLMCCSCSSRVNTDGVSMGWDEEPGQ